MAHWIERAERHSEFKNLGTDWRTEALAGLTTFLTMSYIIFVNPSILRAAGVPPTAVAAATCVSAAIGSLLMGLYARYPIALAPGMGINAYFTYTVVLGMGIPWQAALGAVFLSGILFLVLTFAGVQQAIVAAIPPDLYAAVGAGIGLFLAFIGMRSIGLIVPNDATIVALGDFTAPNTLLGVFGLLVIATLMCWGVKGAIVIGIAGATLVAALGGMVHWETSGFGWDEMTAAAFALDVPAAIHLGFLEIVFVFWFVDLFDNVGTLVAVGNKARLFKTREEIPRIRRILVADGAASTVGSLLGTSTVVSYIESAAGVAAGGRSGVTAAVTGLLFLAALFVTPLVGMIPAAATAPALIVVGCLMMSTVKEIDWDDTGTAIPAFLTIMTIPLSYSIANGLAIGFVSYTLLKGLRGEFRSVSWVMYVLTALFIGRFIYLGGH
jgi:AGZA family xanthine/uracil permease-like MFS transporter